MDSKPCVLGPTRAIVTSGRNQEATCTGGDGRVCSGVKSRPCEGGRVRSLACSEEEPPKAGAPSYWGSEVWPSPGLGPAEAHGGSCVPVTAQTGRASHCTTSCPRHGACMLPGICWVLGISIVCHHLVGVQSS